MIIRKYEEKDLQQMIDIWNEVVEGGIAFPQEDILDSASGKEFFESQSYTGVAEDDGRIVGLYILHPNNVGRCGHICNASYAVKSKCRGQHIRQIVGEAFVTNELFHNWGTEEERRNDVLKYMGIYVDYVYRAGELYANENMTGFIGLEDSYHKPVWPQIRMIFKMLVKIRLSKVKSLLAFAKQISVSNERYAKQRHFEALMVCVDKNQQGKGIASELVKFAKEKADMEGIPLLFDTDMKAYAEMYQHFGCELYNSVKADNGVTRYSLCYRPDGQ